MRNGFFRTRRFAHGSEASLDLFAEDRTLEVDMEEEGATLGSQAEAKRRKERLEREEFIKRSNVRESAVSVIILFTLVWLHPMPGCMVTVNRVVSGRLCSIYMYSIT